MIISVLNGRTFSALTWVADSFREVLINGLRRGISPKHRSNPKFRYHSVLTPHISSADHLWIIFRPHLSKKVFLDLYTQTAALLQLPEEKYVWKYHILYSIIGNTITCTDLHIIGQSSPLWAIRLRSPFCKDTIVHLLAGWEVVKNGKTLHYKRSCRKLMLKIRWKQFGWKECQSVWYDNPKKHYVHYVLNNYKASQKVKGSKNVDVRIKRY